MMADGWRDGFLAGERNTHTGRSAMSDQLTPHCPECDEAFLYPEPAAVDRRDFLRAVGGVAVGGILGGSVRADKPAVSKQPRPA